MWYNEGVALGWEDSRPFRAGNAGKARNVRRDFLRCRLRLRTARLARILVGSLEPGRGRGELVEYTVEETDDDHGQEP